MTFTLSFPEPQKRRIIVTGMMKYAAKLTLDAHCNSGLVVWSGGPGRGKTKCAEWMEKELNEQYKPDDPLAFRVKHYEVGNIPPWRGREDKVMLRSLYHAAIGHMDEGVFRTYPSEAMAELLVHAFQRAKYQIFFVDEAGRLSLNAIDALVLVSDTAGNMKWPLTFVLIGMDGLPDLVSRKANIKRRVHQWCYFKPYNFDETWELLRALHPYFHNLNRKNTEHGEQVKLIHELYSGIPGDIVPFVSRFAGLLRDHPESDPILNIRAAHLQPVREEGRIKQEAVQHFMGKPSIAEGTEDGNKGEKSKRKGVGKNGKKVQ